MKKLIISIIAIVTVTMLFGIYSFTTKTESQLMSNPGDNYSKVWAVIDSLEKEGLPKSALVEVQKLYKRAKQDQNAAQIIKTVIFRGKYTNQLEEDGLVKAIHEMDKEIESSSGIEKPILQSMLAETYSNYLSNNRWKFQNRTETQEFKTEDIRTWTIGQLQEKSNELYLKSVEDKDLITIALEDFQAILSPNVDKLKVRKTLYDFLAFRAINYFNSGDRFLSQPVYKFYLDKDEYLSTTYEFANQKFVVEDSTAAHFLTIQLYQDLILAHQKDNSPSTLIDIDLNRLKFVYQHATLDIKDELFLKGLEYLIEKHPKNPITAEVHVEKANFYYKKGNTYQLPKGIEGEELDPERKWALKEAHEICRSIVSNYPGTTGASQAKSLISQIESKNISVEIEKVNLPGQPVLAKLNYRNVPKVFCKLIKTNEKTEETFNKQKWNERLAFLNALPVLKDWSFNLPQDGDFRGHSTEFKVPELRLGQYLLMVSDNANFTDRSGAVAYMFTQVSNLAYLISQRNDSKVDSKLIVAHRDEGKPMKGVKVEFFKNDYNRLTRKNVLKRYAIEYSDKEGVVRTNGLERNDSYKIRLSYEDDILLSNNWFRNHNYGRNVQKHRKQLFFLDRAIYRPGQILYYKMLYIEYDADGNPRILKNEPIEVVLYDVNRQKVGSQNLVTNDFGTVNGQFTTPQGGLLGQMSLNHYKDFRVEEYKRPKFEVKLKDVEESFRLGDKVRIEGHAKAYAGNVIDGAKIQYHVSRNAHFPYWPWWRWGWYNPWSSPSMEIGNGNIESDEKGNFTIEFDAIADRSIPKDKKPVFIYTVTADVTDITGETHSITKQIKVGYVAIELALNAANQIEKNAKDSLSISIKNLNGQPEQAAVQVVIKQLESPNQVYLKRYWQKPDKAIMSKMQFNAQFPDFAFSLEDETNSWKELNTVYTEDLNIEGAAKILPPFSSWKPGVYSIILTSKDKYGTAVEMQKQVIIYEQKKSAPPIPSYLWSAQGNISTQPLKRIELTHKSSASSLHLLAEMTNRGGIMEKGWTKMKHKLNKKYEVQEADRGGLKYILTGIYKNRVLKSHQVITVPWSNKDLGIEYLTFRDKLKPGQEETWELKITGPKKDKINAEFLAGMYDASLDAFAVNSWELPNLYPSNYNSGHNWQAIDFGLVRSQLFQNNWNNHFSFNHRDYPSLNWFGFNFFQYYGYVGAKRQRLGMRANKAMAMDGAAPPVSEASMEFDAVEIADDLVAKDKESAMVATDQSISVDDEDRSASEVSLDSDGIQVRSNLNETVFFFPNIKTDEEGNIRIQFTMNEALTRWKFMGLAHTPELETAVSTKEVITQKELMIQPNPPRFFREGDKIEFTAKVANLTDVTLNGKAELQLFDAISMQRVDDRFGNTQAVVPFEAKAQQSDGLSWKLSIPFGSASAILYRVIAKAGNFSDGEENALPVLTNRMLVTETMPLPVRGGQAKTFEFDKLKNSSSNTLQHHNYTLEFTSNPAWYAVQSLPYLMEYPYECTEQIFNRFYANSLATNVANSHPKVRSVFEKWRNQEPDALKSNLSKNQELKSALLEETPWVLDAQTEETQKQNIGLLFDLNRMSFELKSAMQKLKDRQSGNGGWPWFTGGRPSWYITQYVVEGMGHLKKLGVLENASPDTKQSLEKAIEFIDFEILKHYEAIEERVEKGLTTWEKDHLSWLALHYLYARTYFNEIEMSKDNKKVMDYFLGQAEKYWLNRSVYAKGMIALALQRKDRMDVPNRIVKSLSENALNHDEMGMYWKYNSGYWWYQLPIETHALMIEVYADVAKDERAVDDLKVWLLKNKQTNNWKTTKGTASAVYALLMSGDNWLLEDKPVQISFPDVADSQWKQQLAQAQSNAESGTGYFKTKWNKEQITSGLGTVHVKNPNKVVAWGATYWQYFEDLDKITTFEDTPLKLKKELFLSSRGDRGEVITPISSSDKLKPGDKLKVRIELRVDRDMEYVHMKDMRASGFEPLNVMSQYKWQGGLGYYESTKDASTNFFFDFLPKGTYVFEYPIRVVHAGNFSNGITTIQSMYAPEFTSHSEGIRVRVGRE